MAPWSSVLIFWYIAIKPLTTSVIQSVSFYHPQLRCSRILGIQASPDGTRLYWCLLFPASPPKEAFISLVSLDLTTMSMLDWRRDIAIRTDQLYAQCLQQDVVSFHVSSLVLGYSLWYYCCVIPILIFLLWFSHYDIPVMIFLLCYSHYNIPVMIFPLWYSRYVIPIMIFLLWYSCYDIPVMLFPLWYSQYDIPVMMFLLWYSHYDIPVMIFPLWYSRYDIPVMIFPL